MSSGAPSEAGAGAGGGGGGAGACCVCGGPATSRCARCRGVWYCGPKCQRAAWGAHKSACAAAVAAASRGAAADCTGATAGTAPPSDDSAACPGPRVTEGARLDCGPVMAGGGERRVVASAPPFVSRADCRYAACYCEENVLRLGSLPCFADAEGVFAVFISNASRAVPIWSQVCLRTPVRLRRPLLISMSLRSARPAATTAS
jgi:hypothetical protein